MKNKNKNFLPYIDTNKSATIYKPKTKLNANGTFNSNTKDFNKYSDYDLSFSSYVNKLYKLTCDEDVLNDLDKLYYYYDFEKNGNSSYNKNDKINLFKKYKITKNVSQEEKSKINSMLKTEYKVQDDNYSYSNIFNKSKLNMNTINFQTITNKTMISIDVGLEDFKNPINSIKKLKINKQIHDKMTSLITQKQVEKISQIYQEVSNFQNKLEKMPNTRVHVDSSKRKINSIYNQDTFIQTNKSEKINEHSMPDNFKFISRENILYSEMHGSYAVSKDRPPTRCQSSVTASKYCFYLIGGLNTDRLIDFWKCEILDNSNIEWKRLLVHGELPLPRMGHTSILYKNQIYIYGGNVEFAAQMPKDDLTIFNLENKKVTIEKCKDKNNLRWRRNHIAEVVGNQMLIHGGIDENGEYLSDCHLLDLDALRWKQISLKEVSYKNIPLAYHSSALVIGRDKWSDTNLNIFKFPESSRNSYSKVKYEGIFLFGGFDNERNLNNQIKVIKIGKKPLEWINPIIKGEPPLPRYSASLNFNKDLDILIVHGGRNDYTTSVCFNDIYVLDLYNYQWISVKIFDEFPLSRSEHVSLIHSNKLYIFGGINTQNYLSSDIYTVNFDFNENKIKKQELSLNNKNSQKLLDFL